MEKQNENPDRYRICQGDIFKKVYFIETVEELNAEELEIIRITFPYIVVLSQDCDLQSDFFTVSSAERNLLSVIVAPIYDAEKVYEGNIGEIGLKAVNIREQHKNRYKKLKDFIAGVGKDEFDRYHTIDINGKNYIIDFKHYFSISVKQLLNKKLNIHNGDYVWSLPALHRERLTQRFCNYLSRIGLPPSQKELEKIESVNKMYEEIMKKSKQIQETTG